MPSRTKNCQIIKATLEEHGYKCEPPNPPITDVDFIVTPQNGDCFELRVHSRLHFEKRYCEDRPQLHIAFPDRQGNGPVCLYHHDKMLDEAQKLGKIIHTDTWKVKGNYHMNPTPGWAYDLPPFCCFASSSINAVRPAHSIPPSQPTKHAPPTSFTLPIAKKTATVNTALPRIAYAELNARQQENYNFHKVAAILADYGFNSMWLNDDWKFADFIAVHIDGETILRVQLKGRFGFDKKYRGKDLWIAFHDVKTGEIYVYPHDELLSHYIGRLEKTVAWRDGGNYHFPSRTPNDDERLGPYQLTPRT